MALTHSPSIVTDNLIFYYDLGNSQKSWIGRPITNSINAATTAIGRYNNPGFSGAATNTGTTYKGMPVYELTFIAQDSSFLPRLAGTEGFGAFHSMTIPLQANTRYMASIYFRTDHPLQTSASQGFANNYSNIPGWGQNSTGSTRYTEDGWTRLYTQYFNSTDGYATRTNIFQTNFTVNTTATQNVDVMFTVPANGSGIADFAYLHAIVSAAPTIASNGGLTGLSIVNHGLNTTDFQKMSWPDVVKLKSTDLPFNYYVRLSVPSTGGTNVTVSIRANFTGYYTALTDNKFWKITFDTTNVSVGQVLRTYWCCPMLEQHSTVYPSTFVNGTRSDTEAILDLTGRNIVQLVGTDFQHAADRITIPNTNSVYIQPTDPVSFRMDTQNFTIGCWLKQLDNSNNVITEDRGTSLIGYIFSLNFPAAGRISLFLNWSSAAQTVYSTTNSSLQANQVQYIVASVDRQAQTINFYVNGQLFDTITGIHSNSISPVSGDMYRTGYDRGGATTNMELYAYHHYTKALSAQEVAQNFSALRSRFGV